MPIASRAPMYARLIWELVRDGRMPAQRKVVLAAATAYLVIGRDIIPDRFAIIGGLDDLIVVVLAVELFLDGVPSDLLTEKLDALGIERAAYDRDIAQVRRMTPAPVRRAIHELPRIIDGAADIAAQAGRSRRPSPGQP
jgi:uncharacterized membrane protein YkvA (DUF1232 family)